MKQFKYKRVDWNETPSLNDLNKEGCEGWELVHIDKYLKHALDVTPMEFTWYGIFKKEIILKE